ncbi:tetratricopeptide repeat protein [Fulvimarina manganoxydans]|uniref:tetratricopeptide repeat protein n=1 Tax=Fulvimarina manganoxydans TaxID=937218 RepID=UPI0014832CA0|nr:SEL1-like repeat protein [Fulvimarina manganoxydans]
MREIAKAIVGLGPRHFSEAAALRPLLRREALLGSSASATAYGMMLQYGIGGAKDIRSAPSWYARAARTGNRSASKHAAITFALGWGIRRDEAKALAILRQITPEARAKEMIKIGEALLQPGREEPDVALRWARRAARLETSATVSASRLYERLASMDPNSAPQIREWLEAVASAGNTKAAIALGERLLLTLNPQDRARAARWFFLAAEKGEPRGIPALMSLLVNSNIRDADEANPILRFLEDKAAEGSNIARVSLGEALIFASQGDEDIRKRGETYLEQAARGGDPEAQFKLAMLLLNQPQAEPDPALARAYLSLAAAKGYPLAKGVVGRLGAMPEAEAQAMIETGSRVQ